MFFTLWIYFVTDKVIEVLFICVISMLLYFGLAKAVLMMFSCSRMFVMAFSESLSENRIKHQQTCDVSIYCCLIFSHVYCLAF